MPTYEYKCDACGHTFEQFQSIVADPIKKCPNCGKNKVKRLISAGAALIFKGSGFYITDYRDAGYKDKAKADATAAGGNAPDAKPAGDSPAPSGAGAGESKPAASSGDTAGGSNPAPPPPPPPPPPKPVSNPSARKGKK